MEFITAIPEFIICPNENCKMVITVHLLCPDMALLDMLMHFMTKHADQCHFELLDKVTFDYARSLELKGV
jgi:hemerythrin-like domain-containing protein